MKLYEILVPGIDNDRRLIKRELHQGWDQWVSNRIGGVTVLRREYKGIWQGKQECMIPVRIACSPEELDEVTKFTIQYYQQDAVMAYEISPNVIIRNKNEVQSR